MEIKGRHLIEGVPKTITITDEEIREALAETVNVIVDAVRVALERTPPELSADIVDRGIVLTGGGSLLKNLDKRLREETGPAAGDGRGPAVVGRARRRQDAVGLQPAAEDLDRLGARRQAAGGLASRPPPSALRLLPTHGITGHPSPQRLPVPRRGGGARHPDLGAGELEDRACRCSRPSPSARSPRCSAATGAVAGGVDRAWDGYVALRASSAENEALRQEAGGPAGRSCSRQRALARPRPGTCATLLDAARPREAADRAPRRSSRASATPEFRTVTIDKGTQRRGAAPTWP